MGELSKYVGEVGESIAKTFFERIGWGASISNKTLPCLYKSKHSTSENKQRTTHGIDRLFSYVSNVEYHAIQNIYISCKNTLKSYPASPVSTFKEHMNDLIIGLECFKRSVIKSEITSRFKGYSTQYDAGVLFWISCDKNTYDNVIEKVSSCRLDTNYEFGNIYIIDNSIVNFHIKILDLIEKNFTGYSWHYYLYETAMGYADKSLTRKTKILPVEYINSRFITFVLINKLNAQEKPKFIIFTKDNFNKDNLEMYIHVAREFTSEMTTDYYIIFPDYDKIQHESDVSHVIMSMPEELEININVGTFTDSGVRGMYNE
ncbi:GapS4a family protein [Providencia stuartii]|uniref:GapS4a family protein n=1 Tax=Providencia stuartii TaxID=588 RepID=UPI0026512E7B|nr:hypothetical protein [Providencia stuartii]MDN7223071.1 hypothetical protein [Providencia stuartii]